MGYMKRQLTIIMLFSFWAACQSPQENPDPLPAPTGVYVDEALCLATGLHGGRDDASKARRSRRLELLQDAGTKLLRWDFRWSVVERTQGDFNFESYDLRVDEAASAGLGWIGLLDYGNPWASSATSSNDKYPPDDPSDFATYAGATVAHFKDRISRWEIWNEQNAGYRFWLPAADPAAYTDLLVAASGAIHAQDPEAKVAFGGTFFASQAIPGALEFIEACYEHEPDLGKYFDAMAIHPYMIYPPAVAPESNESLPPFDYLEQRTLPEMISDLKQLLASHGDEDKPIWITEVGWPEFESVPAHEQARYLVRSYLLSMAAGVEHLCWYTLEDSTGHSIVWEDTFGLVPYDPDPTDENIPEPKPGYFALQNLSKVLSGSRFDEDLATKNEFAEDMHILRFASEDRKRQVLAIWSHGEVRHVELTPSLPGYEFTGLLSMTGVQLSLDSGDSASLDAGPDVIYLLEENTRQ